MIFSSPLRSAVVAGVLLAAPAHAAEVNSAQGAIDAFTTCAANLTTTFGYQNEDKGAPASLLNGRINVFRASYAKTTQENGIEVRKGLWADFYAASPGNEKVSLSGMSELRTGPASAFQNDASIAAFIGAVTNGTPESLAQQGITAPYKDKDAQVYEQAKDGVKTKLTLLTNGTNAPLVFVQRLQGAVRFQSFAPTSDGIAKAVEDSPLKDALRPAQHFFGCTAKIKGYLVKPLRAGVSGGAVPN